eukprot:10994728-Ditylum_brightwellii.AAC.1
MGLSESLSMLDQQEIIHMSMVIMPMQLRKYGALMHPNHTGDASLAADHGWGTEYLIPSDTHKMNITGMPGDSLFSGGPEGNGEAS